MATQLDRQQAEAVGSKGERARVVFGREGHAAALSFKGEERFGLGAKGRERMSCVGWGAR